MDERFHGIKVARTIDDGGRPAALVARIGFSTIEDDAPYWSVTAAVHRYADGGQIYADPERCGAMGDDVVATFADVSAIVDACRWHLSFLPGIKYVIVDMPAYQTAYKRERSGLSRATRDRLVAEGALRPEPFDAEPMHYSANGIFWAEALLGLSRFPREEDANAARHLASTIVLGAVEWDPQIEQVERVLRAATARYRNREIATRERAFTSAIAELGAAPGVPSEVFAAALASTDDAARAGIRDLVKAWLEARLPDLRARFRADAAAFLALESVPGAKVVRVGDPAALLAKWGAS